MELMDTSHMHKNTELPTQFLLLEWEPVAEVPRLGLLFAGRGRRFRDTAESGRASWVRWRRRRR